MGLISAQKSLLELRFLEEDVLTRLLVVLHQLKLTRRGAAVLGGGVEHARTGGALELDLIALALRHDVSPKVIDV